MNKRVTMNCLYSCLIAVLLVQTCHADCQNDEDCGEGGSCNLGTCFCPPGKYGPSCTGVCSGAQECNGGLCIMNTCTCPKLQTGDNCQNKNECDVKNACENGMECDQSSEPYRCPEPIVTEKSTSVLPIATENCKSGTTQNIGLSASLQLIILGMISLITTV